MSRRQGNDIKLGQLAGGQEFLGWPRDARDKHLYVCGGTGTGKSKLLEYLIRQDIADWPKSRCGLMLLDYHGSMYESLMGWLAKGNLKRPIIPIELSRDDWIVGYNPLRPRSLASASVVVEYMVQAMAYVWGAAGTDDTPRFARWAGNIMRALYEKGQTLAEATYLTDRRSTAVRQALTTGLSDPSAAQDWAHVNGLSADKFEAQIESTINRLHRFQKSTLLRASFGQKENSLDLREVLEEGAIVLVSLARDKGRVSPEDAKLFATMLLNDLWAAAQERGKRDNLKPFYVYLDEFQHFVSPTIAENLDEARGFGLHLTLACQYPGQLSDRGPHGVQLLHSVMENATTKVVFRLTDRENLELMAEWLFRGTLNPDEIKLQLYSRKVLDYREEIKESRTTGHTSANGQAVSQSDSDITGESHSETGGEAAYQSTASAAGKSQSWSESQSASRTQTPTLVPIMGDELSHVQYRSLEEQMFRAIAILSDQRERCCVARIADRMRVPAALVTPTVTPAVIRPARVEQYLQRQWAQWPFFLPKAEALQRVETRQALLLEQLVEQPSVEEPKTARRRVQ